MKAKASVRVKIEEKEDGEAADVKARTEEVVADVEVRVNNRTDKSDPKQSNVHGTKNL